MKKKSNESLFFSLKIHYPVLILILFIFVIYGNTFDATWHFDDFTNIIIDDNVHLEEFDLASLHKVLFLTDSQGGAKLYRPVSRFSLALNWYFGKSNVFGYHLVNISIHCLSTVFLYLFINLMLRLPRINIQNEQKILFISLLGALLWSANPIQTQAVTYIVQRMASLAGMFYILGFLLYLKARCFSPTAKKGIKYLAGSILAFFLGIFSKENVFLFPFSILLLEVLLILDLTDIKTRRRLLIFSAMAFVVLVVSGISFFLKGDPLSFLEGYQRRPFTFMERVLTQPRVLIFYLSQIFYPIPGRLNLDHAISVSTSLISPWQTLASILCILFLILLAIYKRKSNPILSFAILFFFLNHSIESSIFNLELIFEHRNYIPSMFLFVPVTIGFYRLVNHYQNKKMYFILIVFGIFFIGNIGFATHMRNRVWYSEKSLWEDCISKNPNSIRSYHNLAWGHYEQIKDFDTAIRLYKIGSELKNNYNLTEKYTGYNNIADLYYQLKDYRQAETYWQKSISNSPNENGFKGLFHINLKLNKVDDALNYLDQAIALNAITQKFFLNNNAMANHLTDKGVVLLRKSNPVAALDYFQKSLGVQPSILAYVGMGTACSRTNYPHRSEFFFKQAQKISPLPFIHIYRADHFYRSNELDNAIKEIRTYISLVSFSEMQTFTKNLRSDFLTIPVHNSIFSLLRNEVQTLSKNLGQEKKNEN